MFEPTIEPGGLTGLHLVVLVLWVVLAPRASRLRERIVTWLRRLG